MNDSPTASGLSEIRNAILDYLVGCQDLTPGEFYGSFWSEKAYHGPLLDYHAGGSHHHRAAGSAALALWRIGQMRNDPDLLRRAEAAFDWLCARQRPSGGFWEVQNNEQPSDWERTGLEECSTIALGFVAHGLGNALLEDAPPKKLYADCLERAGHWQLSIEWPQGSGVFPHHERSPYDTLNANLHAAETLAVAFKALEHITGRHLNIFFQGAARTVRHTLEVQWPDGCFPYRSTGNATINYTALVLWCLLNILDILNESERAVLADPNAVEHALRNGAGYLESSVDNHGQLLWDRENSTAKYNLWTYAITVNVLMRISQALGTETDAADRLLAFMLSKRTDSGLLPMRDRGEEITECAFMQADMLLFLLPSQE